LIPIYSMRTDLVENIDTYSTCWYGKTTTPGLVI
jgi:hypothetical protein